MHRSLVELARQGDEEAFDALVRATGDRCVAIAYRILRDLHLAEDAVQAAYVAAWRDIGSLRDPDRFEAWMHRLLTSAPSWSPDGARIVVGVDEFRSLNIATVDGQVPLSMRLGIVDLSQAEPVLVTIPGVPAHAGEPDWSPDGARILFRTNPSVNGVFADPAAGSSILTIPPEGGDITILLEEPAGGALFTAPSWAPDGRRVLYEREATPDAGRVLRILDTGGAGDESATGAVTTYGYGPRLRPVP